MSVVFVETVSCMLCHCVTLVCHWKACDDTRYLPLGFDWLAVLSELQLREDGGLCGVGVAAAAAIALERVVRPGLSLESGVVSGDAGSLNGVRSLGSS